MKYCPQCDERYDEEIIRFCTKDGTPLIEEDEPNFSALPSENMEEPEDLGEQTVIRRRPDDARANQSERIVIPTSQPEPQVRPRQPAAVYYPPPSSNTAKTVVLTIIGTLFVLACGAGLFCGLAQPFDTLACQRFRAGYDRLSARLRVAQFKVRLCKP